MRIGLRRSRETMMSEYEIAAQKVSEVMALEMPNATFHHPNPIAKCAEDEVYIGCDGVFDPWDIFPGIYGSYSSDFDDMAIEVLQELTSRKANRDDLAARMFREMLCNLNLCEYGTSPRVCFATPQFTELLPDLIEKWKEFSRVQWQT